MSSITPDPAQSPETPSGAKQNNPAVRSMVRMLFYDVGLSVIAYFVAEMLGADTYVALLTGTLVAGVRMAWVGLRERRLDPFALFLVILFGAGLVLSFLTGDARFLLAKDCATTFTAGLVFVGSCIIRRPLAFYAAQRFARGSGEEGAARFAAFAQMPEFRARWYRVSLVWGIGLLIDAALRITVAYTLPIKTAANICQILMIVVLALLTLWTVRSARNESQPSTPSAGM